MYDLIASNKRRSWLLVFLFSLLILGLGWLISAWRQDGLTIFFFAAVFNLLMLLISYYQGDRLILASLGSRPLNREEDRELFQIVENLAITAGLPRPRIYLIPDRALNALATGRDPRHASLAITTGLRQMLTKSELEAVMGHELSHIKNYDIRLMLLAAALAGTMVLLADLLWRLTLTGRHDRRKNQNPLLLPLVVIALILAPLAAQLIKLAISRRREYLADADAALLTRYPEALISALEKIAQQPTLAGRHAGIAHLFIYPPFKKQSWFNSLFSTHPPLSNRIAALRQAANLR
jgi:heat shock protein HtpX